MISVIGAGAFGTALAIVWSRGGRRVRLVARDADRVAALSSGENARDLPGIALPPSLEIDTELGRPSLVAYATPAQTFADIVRAYPVEEGVPGIICAKGIDRQRGALLSDLVPAGRVFAVLSGPGFAGEIARGLPTAMTLASGDLATALPLARTLSEARFRLYASDDPTGVAAGGALKNVAALACGMARGLELGASAEAALATRAARELTGLVVALGGRRETFYGLSGLGDLMLTCSSSQSRNFRCGQAYGRGEAWGEALAEGVHTAGIAARLAAGHGLETPVIDAVLAILEGRVHPAEAMDALMCRPLRAEAA